MNFCKICGKEIKDKNILCDNKECNVSYRMNKKEEEWEKSQGFGDILNLLGPKKYLIRKRGHKCEICGIQKWNGYDVPLVIDHIDGNSSKNTFCNLRLICPNCDAQLPTFKSKNRGNGRRTVLRRLKNKKEELSE